MGILSQPATASDAVVLRTWPSGETSVVASLLTERHGYVRVIAKGARSARSALRPLVQPGRLAALEFGLDPRRDLQYLRGGQLVLDPLAAANSLERTAFLLAAVEIVDRCRPSGAREERLFDLCRRFLQVLSCAAPGGEASLFYAFELALLDLQGLAPVLDSCAGCGAGMPSRGGVGLDFSPEAGGAVCPDCAAAGAGRDGRRLGRDVLGIMRALARADALAKPPEPDRRQAREVGILLHGFLTYHLPEYRLPAGLDLLRAPRRTESGSDGGARLREEDEK